MAHKDKCTRLVYIDKVNIDIYDSLPPNEFKEFFMTYLKYKVGDNVNPDSFSSPLVYSLFKTYQPKIDYNENKWDERSRTSPQNGKKGGRPKNADKGCNEELDKFINSNKESIYEIISIYDSGETEKANRMLHNMFLKSGYTSDCAETQSVIEYINNKLQINQQ